MEFKGFVRNESAQKIVELVQAAVLEAKPAEIAVLTPNRAQRAIIKKTLQKVGIAGVQVSTVHRAQGSEKRTIFSRHLSAAMFRLGDAAPLAAQAQGGQKM